ncbi:MAG: hypothetical protein HZB40_05545 [Rhodocyclales bacterium]|nr:hypothetical protein [Rhodocyclales bacterium]
MANGKYCCFFCPKGDQTERSSGDPCPECGRTFGFPVGNPPNEIGGYRILRSLGRGFYGVTYVAERGSLRTKCVLKITPVGLYSFFKKSFEDECALHVKIAEGASHIIGIREAFDADVTFSDSDATTLRCHVAELDYVDGALLKDYLTGARPAGAATIGQIAIDLLRLRSELEQKELNHNDLHAENLIVEVLRADSRRGDSALDDSIRVKAIDLGSVADASKSDSQKERFGDLSWIAMHIDALLDRFLANPDTIPDRDNRIALALQSVIHGLSASPENHRVPDTSDLIEQIRESFYRATQPWRPWRTPLTLRNFGEHYNAQTLDSWNAPSLLVDPDGSWMREVAKPGPQIVTGMRGCGKTLLLRSLEFHARAAQISLDEPAATTLDRLRSDRFVGLFVWAQRLLDLKEHSLLRIEHRLTRLFIHFGLQAVRALFHLRDIDKSAVAPGAHEHLAKGIGDYLEGADNLAASASLDDLERRVERLAVAITRKHDAFVVRGTPADVFSHLAEQIRRCAEVWQDSTVLFLLDDVSTRYLDLEKVESVLSSLLFSNPICAFKFTSEWQTIELGLKSPGRNHPVRIDRDLALFDLGAEVYRTINQRGKGRGSDFVERILMHRARHYVKHPANRIPSQLLGDVPLETVAKEIAASNENSRQRKEVYRGMSCLAHVCVGDIGDVIKLYEEILKRWNGNGEPPISQRLQSECFQDLSSRRLYDLNRRASYFKDNAKSFAEASHELLVRSYRDAKDKAKPRLRQYASIYVRVTTENEQSKKQQIDRLRDLIDAGVFVFAGGGSPRTKTKDSNPIQQFKLSYRKIYGLANYIGLAERDRFELSGADLEEWLENPQNGKEILLRNLGGIEDAAAEDAPEEAKAVETTATTAETPEQPANAAAVQPGLFDAPDHEPPGKNPPTLPAAKPVSFHVREISSVELSALPLDSALVGLGFEERTRASNGFLAAHCNAQRILAVRYGRAGYSADILDAWNRAGRSVTELRYVDCIPGPISNLRGNCMVDVSGLAKPLIFHAIRKALIEFGKVYICHAAAQLYYPLQEDLDRVLAAEQSDDAYLLLARLGEVLKGEIGPYEAIRLLPDESDESRRRALLAFSSPKHERIFSLLDDRDYDQIEIVCPDADNPRARVARLAGDVISRNFSNAHQAYIDTNDIEALIGYCDQRYMDLYEGAGYNFEIGLTGSKMQAVAAAALSSRRRISQAWYLSPREFDEKRFSSGVGDIRVFEIAIAE